MADDSKPQGFTPPYLSWKTFLNLIQRMKTEGVPAQVDSSYLAKTAPVTQGYLISALKAFGLLNEDKTPRPELHELVENEAERPAIIAALLKKHYADQVALPKNATAIQLWDTFKGQKGETKRKAVTFFLQAAAYADLDLSPMFKAPPRPPGSGKAKAPRGEKSAGPSKGDDGEANEVRDTGEDATSITLPSGETVTLSLSLSSLRLPREERKFINELVDKMQDYEADHAPDLGGDDDDDEDDE